MFESAERLFFRFIVPFRSPLPSVFSFFPFSNTKNFAYLIKRSFFDSPSTRRFVLRRVLQRCKHEGKNFLWFMWFEERKIAIRVTFEYLLLYLYHMTEAGSMNKKNNGNSKWWMKYWRNNRDIFTNVQNWQLFQILNLIYEWIEWIKIHRMLLTYMQINRITYSNKRYSRFIFYHISLSDLLFLNACSLSLSYCIFLSFPHTYK